MLAHNKLMIDNNMSFDEAKVEMQHTWRSIVRTNLMEHLFDNDVLAELQQDGYVNKFYTGTIKENNGMPVEHSTAAYRLFHSRLAGAYRTRGDGQFWSVLPTSSDRKASLMGGFPSQVGQVINWNCFFGAFGELININSGTNSSLCGHRTSLTISICIQDLVLTLGAIMLSTLVVYLVSTCILVCMLLLGSCE